MSGSTLKITACALTLCMLEGIPHSLPVFIHFIMMLGIVMVAAPGVPGGSIMAALGPLASILGFNTEQQALMIALYIAMDSFGTPYFAPVTPHMRHNPDLFLRLPDFWKGSRNGCGQRTGGITEYI